MNAIRKLHVVLAALFLSVFATVARATSVFDPLTTAVSFTDVVTALFAIGAILMAVLVVRKGISWVLAMVGRK